VASLPDVTGQCSASVTAPTATDACAGVITATTTNATSYSSQGDFVVYWTYTDGNGNSATQAQNVKVHDTTAPVPDLASLPDVTGECSATVTAPTATDNCVGSVTGTTADPLSYNAQGTYTVHWSYDDGRGNVSHQNQTVIVKDVTAPVANLATLPTITGQCSATIAAAPTATDNCVGTVTGTTADPLSYSAQGTYTVHWSYDDGNGNVSHQNQTVIVQDTMAPVPDVASLPTITGQCSATIAAAPTATDNCVGSVTGTTADPLSYSAQGTYTVHWSYDDGRGNVSHQNQTVIVHDDQPPVPNVASLPDVTGQCSASVTAPTATDACAGVITATTTNATSYSSQGDFVVYWTYTDGNGNSATQAQNVKVHDTTPPVVSCPANIAVYTTNTSGTAVSFTLPSATDNCGVASVIASPASGSNFPIGDTTVTITATDVNGNASQCTFTVTVTLNHAPYVEDITMGAVENQSRSLLLDKVIAHCFDVDDDQLFVSLPSSTSTNGGTVTLSATAITYTPVANFVGEDRFTYTVDDGKGGVSSATIIVEVFPADALTPNITGSYMSGGVFHVRFAGIPGFTYHIERTQTMSPANWIDLGTVVAPDDGQIDFGDTNPPQGSAFYRTAAPLQ